MQNIEIHWNQAQEMPRHNRDNKAHYLNEFRNSFCDMFTFSDWQHYEEKTGWSIKKLRNYAKYDSDKEQFLKDSLYSMIGYELDEDDIFNAGF